MRVPKNSGFTLIELLVVIAIIAILVALLLPTISKAPVRDGASSGNGATVIAPLNSLFL